MVGLPGSGKSTVVRRLIAYHEQHRERALSSCIGNKNSNHSTGIPVISRFEVILHIDYDALTQQGFRNSGGSDNIDLDPLKTSLFDSTDLKAWRESRVKALESLKDTLINHFTCGNNTSSLLILMDDNFHLRSMRRDVYRTCQEILATPLTDTTDHSQPQISFSSVYLSIPLEVCLQRNSLRSGKERIPTDVIKRMASAIEPPDETKQYASFERFHVSIDNSVEILDADCCLKDNQTLHAMDYCFKKAQQSPISPKNELSREEIAKLEHQRIHQREETLKCQIQQIDQLLRKLVGAVGRVEKKRSREANETRKMIMEDIRKRDPIDTSNETVVQEFAGFILGSEMNSDWHCLENPLAQSINHAYQEFQRVRNKVS